MEWRKSVIYTERIYERLTTERGENTSFRCYCSEDVYAVNERERAAHTFDSCSTGSTHEAVHQRKFARNADANIPRIRCVFHRMLWIRGVVSLSYAPRCHATSAFIIVSPLFSSLSTAEFRRLLDQRDRFVAFFFLSPWNPHSRKPIYEIKGR